MFLITYILNVKKIEFCVLYVCVCMCVCVFLVGKVMNYFWQ